MPSIEVLSAKVQRRVEEGGAGWGSEQTPEGLRELVFAEHAYARPTVCPALSVCFCLFLSFPALETEAGQWPSRPELGQVGV